MFLIIPAMIMVAVAVLEFLILSSNDKDEKALLLTLLNCCIAIIIYGLIL